MSGKANLAASVAARLLNRAKETGDHHHNLLTSYCLERFLSILWPTSSETTLVTCGVLFDPSTMAGPGFDPREIVEFHDLINRQDWGVCERAQKGQRSRGYKQGVYPPADTYVWEFDQLYLRERGPT